MGEKWREPGMQGTGVGRFGPPYPPNWLWVRNQAWLRLRNFEVIISPGYKSSLLLTSTIVNVRVQIGVISNCMMHTILVWKLEELSKGPYLRPVHCFLVREIVCARVLTRTLPNCSLIIPARPVRFRSRGSFVSDRQNALAQKARILNFACSLLKS